MKALLTSVCMDRIHRKVINHILALMPVEQNVCNIQCNIGYRAFLSGMMGRCTYKMPMEFLEKNIVLAL